MKTRRFLFLILTEAILFTAFAAEKNTMSINLHWAKDYMAPIFADAMMTRRAFEQLTFGSGDVAVDENGWPLEDAGVVVWHGYTHRAGVYKLSFEGTADIAAEWVNVTIRNKQYDEQTGKTTAELYFPQPGEALRLKFSNTRGGIRNVKLMRPIEAESEISHDETELFDRKFKEVISRFDVVRYMDPTETNSNTQVEWKDRVQTGESQSQGMAWEYVIRLSNETGTDPWINIPHQANDMYIANLAALFKNFPLDPERKLYVEYSNEVWNTGPGFAQSGWNADEAVRCVQENETHPLNYDKAFTSETAANEKWTLAKRRVPYRAMQISDLFRSVFGDDQMMTRIRPLFCWQVSGGGMNDWGLSGLNFIDGYLRKMKNQTVKDVFWGAGPAGYYSPADDATIENIWDSNDFDHEAWAERSCQYDATMCAAFGLHYVLYEGGPGFGDALGGSGSNPIGDLVWNDPRIYDEMIDHHKAYNRKGGELFCYYVLNHDYRWKFISSVDTADTYKMRAIDDLRLADRDVCEIGRMLPVTVKGGDFDAHKVGWKLNNSGQHNREKGYDLPANEWISYNLLHATDNDVVLFLNYKADAPSKLLLYAGGECIATLDVKASSAMQSARAFFKIPKQQLFALRLVNEGAAKIYIEDMEISDNYLKYLTLKAQPECAAVLSGEDFYKPGEIVRLGMEIEDGFVFEGWYAGEEKISEQSDYSITLTDDTLLTAHYKPVTGIPDNTRKIWLEYSQCSSTGGGYASFGLSDGDTIINNKAYKKFYAGVKCDANFDETNAFFLGGIRQSGQRIYFVGIPEEGALDYMGFWIIDSFYSDRIMSGKEVLLYDFSLEKGDKIKAEENIYAMPDTDDAVTVIEVDSIYMGGVKRKCMEVMCGTNTDTWIEGIGSMRGPLKSFYVALTCMGFMHYLSSVDDNGNRFHISSSNTYPWDENCRGMVSLDLETQREANDIIVYESDKLLCLKQLGGNWKTLKVYKTEGTLLLERNILGAEEYNLPVADYLPGVYLLLFSNDKEEKTVKYLLK